MASSNEVIKTVMQETTEQKKAMRESIEDVLDNRII